MDQQSLHTTKRAVAAGGLFGVFAACALVLGWQVWHTNSLFAGVGRDQLAYGAGAFALTAVVLGTLAALLFKAALRIEGAARVRMHPALVFALVFAVLFAEWYVCLRAYWPGLLTYDIPTQTDYVFTGKWTSQQPPIHTLIWAGFLRLEGVGGLHAITWYALCQMAVLAASLAYAVATLVRGGIARGLFAAVLVFLFLNPVLALFSITPVKDVLLAACFVPFAVQLARLTFSPEAFFARKSSVAAFVFWLVLCCLLRANMIVVVALFALIAFVFMGEWRKPVALLCAAALVLSLGVSFVGNRALGVSSGSSAYVSLPVQQVAHVVVNHQQELSAEDLAVVEAVLPVDKVAADYNPRFADKVVRLFKGRSTGVKSMMGQIVDAGKLWVAWGVRYPADYLDAFVSLNVPYWYPLASVPDPYSERAYIETERWKESSYYTVDKPPEGTLLHGLFERVASYEAFANTPFALVFSPAAPVFFLMLALCALLVHRRRFEPLFAVFFLLFWVSFLFGPVSNMRYVFPLFALFPLLWVAVLQPRALFGRMPAAALVPGAGLGAAWEAGTRGRHARKDQA